MRNIFDHPLDTQFLRNSLSSMKETIKLTQNGVEIKKEELDVSPENAEIMTNFIESKI